MSAAAAAPDPGDRCGRRLPGSSRRVRLRRSLGVRCAEARQCPDALMGIALHATATAASGAEHGGTHGARRDGAIRDVAPPQQRVQQRQEGACRKLERAHLRAPAEQERGLQDIERLEARGRELLLHLALGAQVEVARAGVGPHARDRHEAPRAGGLRGACEGEHAVDVERAKGLLRAGLADARAEAAQRHVAAGALKLRLEPLERDDAIGKARMLASERPPRDRRHARDVRGLEQRIQGAAAGEPARASQQHEPLLRSHRCTPGNRRRWFSDSLDLRPGCGKAKSTVAGAHGDVAAPRHADIPERVAGTARGRSRVLPFLTARRAPTVAAPVRALKSLPLMVVAALLAPAGALAVTDADRLAVYRDFRTAFDAHHYPDALPLATKLVELTEEQFGASDRALVNPLCNLGTTQYRLGDYKHAED